MLLLMYKIVLVYYQYIDVYSATLYKETRTTIFNGSIDGKREIPFSQTLITSPFRDFVPPPQLKKKTFNPLFPKICKNPPPPSFYFSKFRLGNWIMTLLFFFNRLTPSLTRSFSAGNSPVWKLGKLNHVAIAVSIQFSNRNISLLLKA